MAIGRLLGRGFVRIDADTDPAKKALMALGAIGSQVAIGTIGAAFSQSLLPVLATTTTAVVGLANSFVAAGAAAGALTVAVIPQFKEITKAGQLYTKSQEKQEQADLDTARAKEIAAKAGVKYGTSIKITSKMTQEARDEAKEYNKALTSAKTSTEAATMAQKEYDQKLASMPKETRNAATALQGLKDAHKEWSDSLAPETMPIFTRLIGMLRVNMYKLTPLVRTAAQHIDHFLNTMGEGPGAKAVPEFARRIGMLAGPALGRLLNSLRNIGRGFAGMLSAFMPMSFGVVSGFEDMTAKFAVWGQELEKSEGFQKFIENFGKGVPEVEELLENLFEMVITLTQALAPLSGASLVVVNVFADMVNAIPTELLQDLIRVVILVNVALKLYALATAAAALATRLFGSAIMATPLGMMLTLLALLVGAFILAWRNSETFRNIVKGALEAVATAATWLWEHVLKPMFNWIKQYWPLLAGILLGPFGLLAGAFVVLWQKSEKFRSIVKGSLEAVGAAGKWLWEKALKPAFKLITNGLSYLGEGALALVKIWMFSTRWMLKIWLEVVGGIVHGAAKALGWVPGVGGKLKKADEAFRKFKDSTVEKFDKIREKVDAAQRKISGMRGKSIDVKVTGKYAALDYSAKIAAMQRQGIFATGGQIHGPGTGTSDSVPIWGSSGEWVIRERAASKLGNRAMSIINQADRLGLDGDGLARYLGMRGYATGGQIARAQSYVRAADPYPYIWGGVGPRGWDCSGLTGSVYGILTGRDPHRRYFTTMSNFRALGFRPGYGQYTIGVNNSHMVGNIAGLPFEAASSRSGIRVGASAAKVGSFPRIFHLGPAGNWGNGGGFTPPGWMVNRVMKSAGQLALEEIRKDLGWPKRGTVRLYDNGGILPPGLTMALNRTGRNERVVPADGGAGVINLTVENHGVIGSQQEMWDWLAEALDQLDRRGRLSTFKKSR